MNARLHPLALAIIGLVTSLGCLSAVSGDESDLQQTTIKVLSFNIWVGGLKGGQPLSQTAAVIRASQADIVGLQEVKESAQAIADLLGWHYVQQNDSCAILSRFEIVGTTPKKHGVMLRLNDRQEMYAFNVHLPHAPYQPYQLLHIPYEDGVFIKTEQEAIKEARAARGREITSILADIASVADDSLPIVITGDFNEPSHLDWTARAAASGRHPMKVAYPTSSAVTDAGFRDAFRTVHSNEIRTPGDTWTPLTTADDPADHHDRIDFVYFRGQGVTATQAAIIGEHKSHADIIVTPYPSDHRAVVATLTVKPDSQPE